MIDYGAIVKKNGVIISDPNGGLFQNFTKLKYEIRKEEPYDTIVDETVVRCEPTEKDNWKPFNYSFGGNYFAVIGDAQLMIGFYKCSVDIAVDKLHYHYPDIDWISFDSQYKCTHYYRPKYISVNKGDKVLTTIKISRIDEESQVFLATFVYNGDKYEVLYGYGVDPSLRYTFGKGNHYYAPKRKNYFHFHRKGNYNLRKALKRIRYWYFTGLSKEYKEIVMKKYKYNGKL